jgi:hypothetical protein
MHAPAGLPQRRIVMVLREIMRGLDHWVQVFSTLDNDRSYFMEDWEFLY